MGLLAVISFAIIAVAVVPAQAQQEAGADSEQKAGSYWSMVLQGGLLVPLSDFKALNQQSLAGGLRVGWTSKYGLGLDIASEYSPLSRRSTVVGQSLEIHFVTAALMPRLTLGRNAMRLWLSAGGGVAYERTSVRSGMEILSTDNKYALCSIGAAGLEFQPISGLGLAVVGTYNRTRGNFTYEFVNVTGGLSFTFR